MGNKMKYTFGFIDKDKNKIYISVLIQANYDVSLGMEDARERVNKILKEGNYTKKEIESLKIIKYKEGE